MSDDHLQNFSNEQNDSGLDRCVVEYVFFASEGRAEDLSISITIKDHRFYPSVTKVPAGVPFKIVFINTDKTSEDPASESMYFEKTVAGGARQVIEVDALKVGSYNFFGQFSRNTAQGTRHNHCRVTITKPCGRIKSSEWC